MIYLLKMLNLYQLYKRMTPFGRRVVSYCFCVLFILVVIWLIWLPIESHINLIFMPSEGVIAEYNLQGGGMYSKNKLSSLFYISAEHTDSAYRDLKYSTYLFGLESVSIHDMKLTEKYFKRISAHNDLRHLSLHQCDFDIKWLTYLAKCRRLFTVDLEFNSDRLQWNVIKSLEKNDRLQEISLRNAGITNEDMIVLDRLSDLECLGLYSCEFSNDKTEEKFYEFIEKRADNLVLAVLANIPNIERHIQAIIDKPELDKISIASNNITDELISNIRMPIMPVGHNRQIIIKSNSISDDGLMHIRLEPRTILRLTDTTITEEGLKNFLQANPSLTGQFNTENSIVELYRK
jgi:hypothetical protein